jgi:DNA mismatch repair protein MutS
VILDEVGRGTSTYDGLALAWAVAEAVHETNRCRCLFATHYHEMQRLAETCPALSLHHVRAREWKGDLVLLHELAQGRRTSPMASPSRGSPACPKRWSSARAPCSTSWKRAARPPGALPPAWRPAAVRRRHRGRRGQVDALRDKLNALDIDALSPRAALDLLYDLKREANS